MKKTTQCLAGADNACVYTQNFRNDRNSRRTAENTPRTRTCIRRARAHASYRRMPDDLLAHTFAIHTPVCAPIGPNTRAHQELIQLDLLVHIHAASTRSDNRTSPTREHRAVLVLTSRSGDREAHRYGVTCAQVTQRGGVRCTRAQSACGSVCRK